MLHKSRNEGKQHFAKDSSSPYCRWISITYTMNILNIERYFYLINLEKFWLRGGSVLLCHDLYFLKHDEKVFSRKLVNCKRKWQTWTSPLPFLNLSGKIGCQRQLFPKLCKLGHSCNLISLFRCFELIKFMFCWFSFFAFRNLLNSNDSSSLKYLTGIFIISSNTSTISWDKFRSLPVLLEHMLSIICYVFVLCFVQNLISFNSWFLFRNKTVNKSLGWCYLWCRFVVQRLPLGFPINLITAFI